jgi:oxygen-independent coproporphyrinogen-3 oxidase
MAGIYLHIPFCKQACYYCDFHFSTSLQYKTEMLEAMKHEISSQKSYLDKERIDTIYFGGGTPSLLQPEEINYLLDELFRNHEVEHNAEITLEANPDDLNPARIKQLQQTPVNRLSIGIQSFFDDDLKWMNRAHRSIEAENAVKRAQDAGLDNITIDLIYGYPLLTDQKWQHNISQAFALQVPHISAYSMTIEPQTALASFIRKGKQPAMNEEQSARQFLSLMDAMERRGYEHYEISNFCIPNHYSKHNSNYWKGVKYLGIGPSAHSFNGYSRQWNIANNAKYIQYVRQNQIAFEIENLSDTDKVNEYVMTSLRTMWGLNLDKLALLHERAADDIKEAAAEFISKGWLRPINETLTLTKSGKLYADHIAAELFIS